MCSLFPKDVFFSIISWDRAAVNWSGVSKLSAFSLQREKIWAQEMNGLQFGVTDEKLIFSVLLLLFFSTRINTNYVNVG